MYGLSRKLWRCWISIAFLVFISVSFAGTSQPPSPAPSKSSQKPEANPAQHEEAPAKDQRGTETSPLFIKVAPSQTVEPEPSKEHEKARDYTSAEWWLVYVTGFLTAVTLVLAIFTGWLWNATKKLVQGADDTARRQLRAYISMIGAEDVKGEGGHFGFRVRFKNTGQTPAYDVIAGAWVSIAPFPRTDPLPDVPITEKSRSTFGPGIDSGLFPSRSALMPSELAGIEDMTLAIYIHGRIEYRDAFDKPRTTHFTMIKRKSPSGLYILGNDRDGNHAT